MKKTFGTLVLTLLFILNSSCGIRVKMGGKILQNDQLEHSIQDFNGGMGFS